MAARANARTDSLLALDTLTLRDRLASGAVRAGELARACISRVAEREGEVQAWAWLDEEHVMAEAARLDALRTSGRPIGPLHGLPVALKDVIDTARIPTENGTALDAGRVPVEDATVVRRLKAAGALIMGKTVTAELAFLHPGKTRNPHDPGHTPGGSSSGSAAAVAAGMVPLALGTQTGGSVIRPAAYCGIVGFKPSFGAIPRTGILQQSPTLDTVGVFATSVEAAALLAETLFCDDPADRSTRPTPPPRLLDTALARAPVRPTLALLPKLPVDPLPDQDTAGAFAELSGLLGEAGFEIALPPMFGDALRQREIINFAEMAKCYYSYERRGRDALSEETLAAIDAGKAIPARDYLSALDWPGILNSALDEIFDRCDAIAMPSTPGAAPKGLASTGPSAFNGLWTLCGTPVVTLPLFAAPNGLPMGLQLIGRRGDDARLLRTARWLGAHLASGQEG
ncbi:amidase [Polymorphum gilvum]|uniref:Asp-tRNA Asn/Glu-tRNA Gln amidotransferase subunit A n=1 Tax=Polymorphum gilvum (strain LMG 25793 / CGMCC 1.9160 / SL003B-26A1) TaxID=991905 RepID=F2J4T6_POLGS|nr:amidase [Polymorphum gilvum]ADZ69028.1 Asp-tRNA Asn/Glu-tRNA Gln amidotransferase subunit A [Polymorphum gilvum SL003B-26A1]